jgi:hypothetical protein
MRQVNSLRNYNGSRWSSRTHTRHCAHPAGFPLGPFPQPRAAHSLLLFPRRSKSFSLRAIPTKPFFGPACVLSGLQTASYVLIQSQTKWRATGRSKDDFGQRFSWAPLAFSPQRRPSPPPHSFTRAPTAPARPLPPAATVEPQRPTSDAKRQTPPAPCVPGR